MGRTCGGKCGMVFLIIINIIFLLLGLAMLVLGVLMQVNVEVIDDKIMPLLQQLSFGSLNLGDLASGLSITFIVFGSVILIIAMLGAFGACCQNKCCLIIYSVIVGIFLVGKIVAVVLWFVMNDKLQSWLKDNLLTQLNTNYKNDDLTTHEISTSWNYLFVQLSCCGVNPVTGVVNDFDNTVWMAGSPGYQIPKGCCSTTTIDNYATHNPADSCDVNVVSGYYTTGCYDAVYNKLSTYSTGFIVTGVLVLVVEIIAIISAILVCKGKGEDEVV